MSPHRSVEIDTDDLAFPEPFSALKSGDYQVQAVLDVDHTYDYSGRAPGDLISEVVPLPAFTPGQGAEPDLILNGVVPARPAPTNLPSGFDRDAHQEDFVSPVLSAFFGQPVHMRAWVVVPPGYEANCPCTLSHGLLDARLRRQSVLRGGLRLPYLSAHGARQNAAHDLGDARRILRHRYT